MNTRLREAVLAGATFGMLGMTACAIEAPTTGSPSAAAALSSAPPSAQESYVEACPFDEGEVEQICRDLNAGRNEEQIFDYFIPRSIYPGEALTICPCPGVFVCVDNCPPVEGRTFVGHEAIYSATVEGSHCEELCTSTTGGTGTKYTRCVRNCRATH
jgi:hypothetical protein